MPTNIIQNIKTHFNICEDNPDNIRSVLGSSTIKVTELRSFCKDNFQTKKLSAMKKKDFVNLILSKIDEEDDEEIELEPFPIVEPDTIISSLSAFEITSDDDASENESENEEEDNEELVAINEGVIPGVHNSVDELPNLCNTAKLTVVLVHSTHCPPCVKFMKKFKKFVDECETNRVNFGLLDVDTYTTNVGLIPEEDISELPAIQFYRGADCVKTMYKPTLGKIEKSITSLTKKSISSLKEECKTRGLSLSGKKEDLENRLKEDNERGWNLHTKSKAELIDYLTGSLKTKSKKHEDMDEIALIKKIRKVTDKKELESEMRYEILTERFQDEIDVKKVMAKMTIKQLRVLIDNGFLSTSAPSFPYLKHENEDGETVKALTKTEIISKFN